MQAKYAQPKFEPSVVASGLSDGYWLDAVDVDGDGRLDLVASGLAEGEVVWYRNPGWEKHPIAQLDKPVAMDHMDLTGNSLPDLVVCHDYGECMYRCRPGDGTISWLQNTGNGSGWSKHFVADLVATHRLRMGYFTQTERPELLALPVVGPQGGMEAVHSPVQVMLYPRPDDPAAAEGWQGSLVDGSTFRVIHDVVVGKFANDGLTAPRDSVLLATEEGISWFHCANGSWQREALGRGELSEEEKTHFKGTGNLAVGKVEGDPFAYIATIEPFHGNVVAVYTKATGSAPGTLSGATWKRTVLDVFGDPNDVGEGPGHPAMTADFDGDGDDEFLVALRGPWPWQGVFYYKCIDVENAVFTKTRVSSASAARIALGDFDGDGRIDFATTGYYTPGYFLCDDPQIIVFYNRIAG